MLSYILSHIVTGIVSGYLPFESHRMQLVELFDNLFDLFENDPEFKSFHLDGQTIVLDDYLEIRPENRDKVQRYIDEGKT